MGAKKIEWQRNLRATGATYQSIADALGLSIGTVWQHLNKDKK